MLGWRQLAVEIGVQCAFIHVRHAALLPRVLRHTLRRASGAPAPMWFRPRRALTLFARRFHRRIAPSPTTATLRRSEEHMSELSHANISYAVFCLKKKKNTTTHL